MRLINVRSYKLETFLGSQTPPYAILSHTWGKHEISFEQMQSQGFPAELSTDGMHTDPTDGYMKIFYACQQARSDGLEYAWVDTCCIDKSSSAEISEAINSMFHWYRQAEFCYAYLSDVQRPENPGEVRSQFRHSKWFTRGWTLQELLAPMKLRFYCQEWQLIGPITALYATIEDITGIKTLYLQKDWSPFMFRHASIATRMSWASKRETTRLEDMAYSLLGIFDVNMPLLYGEGEKAFIRLQEEIMKQSDDETILAWGYGRAGRNEYFEHGFLATSPRYFTGCRNMAPWPSSRGGTTFSVTSRGLLVTVPVWHNGGDRYEAILRCSLRMDVDRAVSIPLVKLDNGNGSIWNGVARYSRADDKPSMNFIAYDSLRPTTICISHRPWWPQMILGKSWTEGFYVRNLPVGCFISYASPPNEWSPPDNVMAIDTATSTNEPRILFGSFLHERFVIRFQYMRETKKWVCGIATRQSSVLSTTPITKEEVAELEFSNQISLQGRRMSIVMKEEKVFNKTLMVIDVNERPMEWVWELGTVLLGVGIASVAATPFVLMARRRRQ